MRMLTGSTFMLEGGRLGALSPGMQGQIEDRLATLNALEEQVVHDLILVGRQGADVTDTQVQLDVLSEAIVGLDTEVLTMVDDEAGAWHGRADEVEAALRAMVDELATTRSRLQEGQRFIGLWWGIGVSAAVATTAWYVWRRRRRRGGR